MPSCFTCRRRVIGKNGLLFYLGHSKPLPMTLSTGQKLILIACCFALGFCACKNPGPHPANDGKDSSHKRNALIGELRLLSKRSASKDVHEIGKIYSFPIPDSVVRISIGDSVYDQVSDTVFYRHYKKIEYELELSSLHDALRKLNLDSLRTKNKIERNFKKKTEVCYDFYEIEITNDSLVSIMAGSNTNSDYEGEHSDAEDSGACEHTVWWNFILDGNKLRLVKMGVAG